MSRNITSEMYEYTNDDNELMREFVDSLHESMEVIENDLLILERDPHNDAILNSLFREIHSIKGNCGMCMLTPFTQCLHTIEEMVSELRSHHLTMTPFLKEALLFSMDMVRHCLVDVIENSVTDIALMKVIAPKFHSMCTHQAQNVEITAAEIIHDLSGDVGDAIPFVQDREAHIDIKVDDNSEDLQFFHQTAEQVDSISPYWEERTPHILQSCFDINAQLSEPVDTEQLQAASYIHDLGMTIIPREILLKEKKLTPVEREAIRQHPLFGYEWLRRIPGWDQAAIMVLQHHERPDGKGYPNQLKGDEICKGAQVLAIADTFFSLTTQRADRTYKKTIVRAVTEINAEINHQFKPEIVHAFNEMFRLRYTKAKSQS